MLCFLNYSIQKSNECKAVTHIIPATHLIELFIPKMSLKQVASLSLMNCRQKQHCCGFMSGPLKIHHLITKILTSSVRNYSHLITGYCLPLIMINLCVCFILCTLACVEANTKEDPKIPSYHSAPLKQDLPQPSHLRFLSQAGNQQSPPHPPLTWGYRLDLDAQLITQVLRSGVQFS